MARFSNLQSQVFRLSGQVSISSNISGQLASTYIYNDPTGSFGNFDEHVNYLVNLFQEMKVVRSNWHLVPLLPLSGTDAKDTTNGVVAVGVFNRGPSSLPTITTLNQVLDNQPSKLWAIQSDTSGRGLRMSARYTRLNYLLATTTSQDYAGCPGGLVMYGSGLPPSIAVMLVHYEVFIRYRARS